MSGRDHERSDALPPPRSADEALARAREHGLAAVGEGLLAVRALADAASLAVTGAPAEAHASLTGVTAMLDQLAAQMQSGAGRSGAPWLDAVARVLDDEIARWETRGRDDPEARAVLRAFLGVREILWEFGLRPSRAARADAEPAETQEPAQPAARRAAPTSGEARSDTLRARTQRPRRGPQVRIERVPVEG